MKNKYYYFCKTLNDKIKKNILKFSDISIIFYNSLPNPSSQELNQISSFCKKNNMPFYVYNNYQLAVKIKAQGIYLDSRNRNFNHLFSNKLKIIGSAHNQMEYFNKLKQGCDLIMLSPIFSNVKYSRKVKELINLPKSIVIKFFFIPCNLNHCPSQIFHF
jgi:thiamine monophosphate synthase